MAKGRAHLTGLVPAFAQYVDYLVAYCEAVGLRPVIVEGYRSPERQAQLYAQGRSRPGQIVTKAKAGESAHNYGLACDITSEDGWDSPSAHAIHRIAAEMGFGTIAWDTPHVEWPNWRRLLR